MARVTVQSHSSWLAVPTARSLRAAVPDGPTSAPRLSASDSASLRTNTRATDSPACLSPPRSPFQLQPVTLLPKRETSSCQVKCTSCFTGRLKKSDFKCRKGRNSCNGQVFLLRPEFLAPRRGRTARAGRLETETVWCGSGTFCLVRGQAQELLVSFKKAHGDLRWCHGAYMLQCRGGLDEGGACKTFWSVRCAVTLQFTLLSQVFFLRQDEAHLIDLCVKSYFFIISIDWLVFCGET